MSSKAKVTISNFTKESITTEVTRDYWVEEDGKSINGKVIPKGEDRVFEVVAKTGHHGELDINLLSGDTSKAIGNFEIKSIKDPQNGEKSLKTTPLQDDINMVASGQRSSEGDKDLRQIKLIIAQK